MLKELWRRLTGEPLYGAGRNPKFAAESKAFLRGKCCAACGGTRGLQTHHIYPVHLFPEREMVKEFWVPLCTDGVGGMNCHLIVGHGGNFQAFNPNIVSDAVQFRAVLANLRRRLIT